MDLAPPRWCRRCSEEDEDEEEETRPSSQELRASDGATRCGRCRRHRAGTLPWWRQRAAAERCADAAAATARWLGAARER